jgi:hypothetical protein
MDRQYLWFVEPKDADTNEIIARSLSLLGQGSGRAHIFIDNTGKEIKGWEVDHSYITELQKNVSTFNLKFEVYVKEGGSVSRKNKLHLYKKKKAKTKKIEVDLNAQIERTKAGT